MYSSCCMLLCLLLSKQCKYSLKKLITQPGDNRTVFYLCLECIMYVRVREREILMLPFISLDLFFTGEFIFIFIVIINWVKYHDGNNGVKITALLKISNFSIMGNLQWIYRHHFSPCCNFFGTSLKGNLPSFSICSFIAQATCGISVPKMWKYFVQPLLVFNGELALTANPCCTALNWVLSLDLLQISPQKSATVADTLIQVLLAIEIWTIFKPDYCMVCCSMPK